eukprot:325824_1
MGSVLSGCCTMELTTQSSTDDEDRSDSEHQMAKELFHMHREIININTEKEKRRHRKRKSAPHCNHHLHKVNEKSSRRKRKRNQRSHSHSSLLLPTQRHKRSQSLDKNFTNANAFLDAQYDILKLEYKLLDQRKMYLEQEKEQLLASARNDSVIEKHTFEPFGPTSTTLLSNLLFSIPERGDCR